MNPKAPGSTVSLGPMLETTAAALGRQWGCRITARVEPEGTQISATEELQLRLILAEAIANAARHGGASSVEISARAEDRVVIEVFDNGTAGDRVSAVGKAAPFSLAQRVTEMGGSCRLEVSATGAHLFVDLPRT
jgi:two-component system sensor histidine kinase UhpB